MWGRETHTDEVSGSHTGYWEAVSFLARHEAERMTIFTFSEAQVRGHSAFWWPLRSFWCHRWEWRHELVAPCAPTGLCDSFPTCDLHGTQSENCSLAVAQGGSRDPPRAAGGNLLVLGVPSPQWCHFIASLSWTFNRCEFYCRLIIT